MMYIRTSSRPSARRSRIITLITGGLIVLVIIIQSFIPHFLPALFTTIARPFWRMEFSVSSGSLESSGALLAKNQALEIQLQTLMAQNNSVDMVRTENSELLGILGRPGLTVLTTPIASSASSTTSLASSSTISLAQLVASATGNSRTVAAVLVRPPFSPFDELVVDAGSDQGILPGEKVFAPGDILIGTTTSVLGQTTNVRLFSSPGETYQVLIGANHIPANAVGRGGGQYEAEVPQATVISEGDIVTDATITDGNFGTVTAVVNNPSDPFETILFAPQININQLRWVLIGPGIPVDTSTITVHSIPTKATSTKVKK